VFSISEVTKIGCSTVQTSLMATDHSSSPPPQLSSTQDKYLDSILQDTLWRMSFFMETNFLLSTENNALKSLFETCIESVYISESKIPGAGRGLFAKKDIKKGTIVAFYPVHCVGLQFEETGLCNSAQISLNDENGDEIMIDVKTSSYTLLSLTDRDLCGVNLKNEFGNCRLFVDMINPNNTRDKNNNILRDGWYCGLCNDGAIVRYEGDVEYYRNSREAQNVEIIPFSAAPFHVGVTTRDVKQFEELYVSYGYNYWEKQLSSQDNEEKEISSARNRKNGDFFSSKLEFIQDQEKEAKIKLLNTIESVEQKYEEESFCLAYYFNNMNKNEPPSIASPPFQTTRKRKRSFFKKIFLPNLFKK